MRLTVGNSRLVDGLVGAVPECFLLGSAAEVRRTTTRPDALETARHERDQRITNGKATDQQEGAGDSRPR